ncbi:TIGR00366 family protein [Algoriphagus sp.]|uniref:TIGR00366 family protein n=1 Tax=Algoriphagus sp. TaxID=1872435 RepID=UPI00272206C0|nr:TIGR00366 family protein [Algoriphagus sp.]MDO8966282.1 TIGR00366 family protein [Algoriphagus sp.]MDP3198291.1 TIGR00366 family protein [Algoriphagus sp.]
MRKPGKENLLDHLISPFGLVLILTFLTFSLVLVGSTGEEVVKTYDFTQAFGFWQNGFFGLMGFTLQMMMILVFGFSLAVFKPVNLFLRKLAQLPSTLVSAVLLTAAITMIAGLLNWGFGLIVGAVLARFMQQALLEKGQVSNPALLAASGYLGMGIWHGGFSGSAPLSVAESGHFLEAKAGVIPVEFTLFSAFNLVTTFGLFLIFMGTAWYLARNSSKTSDSNHALSIDPLEPGKQNGLARIAGLFMLGVILVGVVFAEESGLGFVSLNWVNFLLFSITLIAYRSSLNFSNAIANGLKSSADIFIQFPFYAGILGLITESGLLNEFVKMGNEITNPESFPLFSFFSAALVNFFIPSGGGQWAVQGPIILETSAAMGLDTGKMVMVFAFGDQISNLLQPFWALPLLSITGVSVRKIFPYTLVFFLVGLVWLWASIFFFF